MFSVTADIKCIGVKDRVIDLFEGQYSVPNGMTYNSYVILDEKTAVFDTVDAKFTDEWLDDLSAVLAGRQPDYIIVQHMEPDHSANLANFLRAYPDTEVVANSKTFTMIDNFFGKELCAKKHTVSNGDTLSLGRHLLSFTMAPMVHWPEVMVTYDSTERILFSADAFGTFGADGNAAGWDDEARRYYIGIVGKYGAQVQTLLKAASALDISAICPLHGPVLDSDIGHYIEKYGLWSSYTPETDGVVIAYASVYGNTKAAVSLLAEKLRVQGCPVVLHDLARDDMSQTVADAFRYDRLVLASTTYNGDVFPFMKIFIDHLTERGFRRRTVGFIENGSWAPMAAKVMKKLLEGSKELTTLEPAVTIRSAMTDENRAELSRMAEELCAAPAPAAPAEPAPSGKKRWVCQVCGYVYEGDELPADFVCPLCKRGAADFQPEQ